MGSLATDSERFVLELEMVQCLASADYLHCTYYIHFTRCTEWVWWCMLRGGFGSGLRARAREDGDGRDGGRVHACRNRSGMRIDGQQRLTRFLCIVSPSLSLSVCLPVSLSRWRARDINYRSFDTRADLAEKKYLDEPAFIEFLKYLLYWYATLTARRAVPRNGRCAAHICTIEDENVCVCVCLRLTGAIRALALRCSRPTRDHRQARTGVLSLPHVSTLPVLPGALAGRRLSRGV